jgi:hypothetical protein
LEQLWKTTIEILTSVYGSPLRGLW